MVQSSVKHCGVVQSTAGVVNYPMVLISVIFHRFGVCGKSVFKKILNVVLRNH